MPKKKARGRSVQGRCRAREGKHPNFLGSYPPSLLPLGAASDGLPGAGKRPRQGARGAAEEGSVRTEPAPPPAAAAAGPAPCPDGGFYLRTCGTVPARNAQKPASRSRTADLRQGKRPQPGRAGVGRATATSLPAPRLRGLRRRRPGRGGRCARAPSHSPAGRGTGQPRRRGIRVTHAPPPPHLPPSPACGRCPPPGPPAALSAATPPRPRSCRHPPLVGPGGGSALA